MSTKRRSARLAALKRKRNEEQQNNDTDTPPNDSEDISEPPQKKLKKDTNNMNINSNDSASPFPTEWNTSDDESDTNKQYLSSESPLINLKKQKRLKKKKKFKKDQMKIDYNKKHKKNHKSKKNTSKKRKKKSKNATSDEEYTINIEEKNDYSDEDSVELLNGFDDNTNKNKKNKKRKTDKKKDKSNSDISIKMKPKKKKVKKRKSKKQKGEYNKEQIEFVFNTLDEEGNGIITINNVMNGFRAINQNDVMNWELAKKMLDYADKQYDNDFQVRFDDFLSICRLANLCYQ